LFPKIWIRFSRWATQRRCPPTGRMPVGARVCAFKQMADVADRPDLASDADVQLHRVSDTEQCLAAVRARKRPLGGNCLVCRGGHQHGGTAPGVGGRVGRGSPCRACGSLLEARYHRVPRTAERLKGGAVQACPGGTPRVWAMAIGSSFFVRLQRCSWLSGMAFQRQCERRRVEGAHIFTVTASAR
jgi:hypothetical protein